MQAAGSDWLQQVHSSVLPEPLPLQKHLQQVEFEGNCPKKRKYQRFHRLCTNQQRRKQARAQRNSEEMQRQRGAALPYFEMTTPPISTPITMFPSGNANCTSLCCTSPPPSLVSSSVVASNAKQKRFPTTKHAATHLWLRRS